MTLSSTFSLSVQMSVSFSYEFNRRICRLSGNGVHTLNGVAAYAEKDEGEPHYLSMNKGFTDAELDEGRELYARW